MKKWRCKGKLSYDITTKWIIPMVKIRMGNWNKNIRIIETNTYLNRIE